MSDEPHIVRYTPRPLTEEEQDELRRLADLPDDQIDFSDIPELGDDFFKNAVRGLFRYPPVQLGADIIEWFREKGLDEAAMTMEINHLLLDHIAREKRKAARRAG